MGCVNKRVKQSTEFFLPADCAIKKLSSGFNTSLINLKCGAFVLIFSKLNSRS